MLAVVSMLKASVAAGESGPVVTLSGETDLASAGQLSDLLTAQLAGGVQGGAAKGSGSEATGTNPGSTEV